MYHIHIVTIDIRQYRHNLKLLLIVKKIEDIEMSLAEMQQQLQNKLEKLKIEQVSVKTCFP